MPESIDVDDFAIDLADQLGAPYRVSRDQAFLWVTPFDAATHQHSAQHAHYALARLAEFGLSPAAQLIPAILLQDTQDQLTYHGLFAHPDDPEDTSIIDGGCWRSWPVSHLAIPVSSWDSMDAAFAHELAHAILAPDGIPNWLQEGVAMEIETCMGNRTDPLADSHGWKECLSWWQTHDQATLWSGEAFSNPESSRFAYLMAQVLTFRWTRRPGGLSQLRTPGAAAWLDPDTVLEGMCGLDRSSLLSQVLSPPAPRGWLTRWLFKMLMDEQRAR